MEIVTVMNSFWINVLDFWHYFFLIALLVLLVVYVVKLFKGKKSSNNSQVKSHRRHVHKE